ncbi:MAG: Rab B GTPase [Promethearchaeota archaeon CR_4]|nr:MAG: Rab B GTPase [Candidatus Lokiarchaeota archaeon CR_4]
MGVSRLIRDVYIIIAATGQCIYHKSYSRTPVDETLVSGFLGAMGTTITMMQEGVVKNVPASTYSFTYTHAKGFLYVICTDQDDDKQIIATKVGEIMQVCVEKNYTVMLQNPNLTKEKRLEIEDTLDKILTTEIKVALVGFGGIGKTTMYRLVQGQEIPLDNLPTMFVTYKKLEEKIADQEILLWDFAGQERFTPLWPMLLRGTQVILLVTDSTVENVLQTKRVFIGMIKKTKPEAIVYAIANKQDRPKAMSAKLVSRVLGVDTYEMCAIDPSERQKLQGIITQGITAYLKQQKEKENRI